MHQFSVPVIVKRLAINLHDERTLQVVGIKMLSILSPKMFRLTSWIVVLLRARKAENALSNRLEKTQQALGTHKSTTLHYIGYQQFKVKI